MSVADTRPGGAPLTLLCLAHLEWDHVWQRPQQLLTRLASSYRAWYVDPPEVSAMVAAPELCDLGLDHGVRVIRPRFPAAMVTRPEEYWAVWRRLLPCLLDQAGPDTILWVSAPHAHQLVELARPEVRLTVYDCMDDLTSFKDGTPEMRDLETRLMALSDLIFTGGHSMYQARKDRHPRVHCFPSGVDVAHYRPAREYTRQAMREPEAMAPRAAASRAISAIPRPRLGYFGVLDERIDWELIAAVADRRPEWHWALIGPTAKVDPRDLPRADNIHYLGKQAYADLPALLAHFDVATMPFALNEATRYISPTKTLEYLAGGKWVLSSPVPDVAACYEQIVAIAEGSDAWVDAIERILLAGPAALEARLERAQPVLEANTWDAIAARMAALIDAQLAA